jgi:hypothetical protein
MARYTFVVFSDAVEGREDEYNEWYDGRHLGDVLNVPGFVSARRFLVAGSPNGAPARYMALYEIETDDVGKVLAELFARSGTPAMELSDALDMQSVKTWAYREITA